MLSSILRDDGENSISSLTLLEIIFMYMMLSSS
jgi:hypothetical protein